MSAPLSDAQLDEIEARAQLAYDGGDPLQTTGYDVPALVAEVRRLRGDLAVARSLAESLNTERQLLARAGADRADERDAAEGERVRLATELGARDAELAALQVEHQDLQAAYDRLGDQAQRIVEAASQFRAERDRLHDALSGLLLGAIGAGWESSGAGGVRSPWIPAGQVAGWRQVLAGTERSERDGDPIGETAQNGPVAPADGSRSPVDAQGAEVAQRGAAGHDGHTQVGRPGAEAELG